MKQLICSLYISFYSYYLFTTLCVVLCSLSFFFLSFAVAAAAAAGVVWRRLWAALWAALCLQLMRLELLPFSSVAVAEFSSGSQSTGLCAWISRSLCSQTHSLEDSATKTT